MLYFRYMDSSLAQFIEHASGKPDVKLKFLNRLDEGNLTRPENPTSHFCVYFAAVDPFQKSVFIGLHKKSGLWLFNGGHLDKDETLPHALIREASEEWGIPIDEATLRMPELATITEIEHPERQICEWHYDLWYFLPFSAEMFHPDPTLLATEFQETGWFSYQTARLRVTDPATLEALDFLENRSHNS